MANLLTSREIQELTGYSRPSYQAAWLSRERIRYYRNARGEIQVPSNALTDRPEALASIEPDFGQFGHGQKKTA